MVKNIALLAAIFATAWGWNGWLVLLLAYRPRKMQKIIAHAYAFFRSIARIFLKGVSKTALSYQNSIELPKQGSGGAAPSC